MAEPDWDHLIEEFRALGGVVENVRLGTGDVGRGLFTRDPSKPARITVPDNLLFAVENLEFENGALRCKPSGSGPTREERFFEEYQAKLSWGAGGETDCAAFFDAMNGLPDPVREILTNDWGLKSLFVDGGDKSKVQQRFLRTRMIGSKGRNVVMPVLELVNHSTDGCPFDFKSGISISGTYPGEMFARYNLIDALGVFSIWGFASMEQVVFSLPMSLPLKGKRRLVIKRKMHELERHKGVRLPVMAIEGSDIVVTHLMLGNKNFLRVPRGVFKKLMNKAELENADEIFDRIRQFNGMRFLNLLSVLDDYEGPTITNLRKMCRYQLTALMYCVGEREV